MITILSREDILDNIKKAKELTWISDQGYWSRQGTIEHWELCLERHDAGQTIAV